MNRRTYVLMLMGLLGIFANLNAQKVDIKNYNLEDGIAIQGYDPVAYFTENKALEGNESIRYTKDGVTYYFSSSANKVLFEKDPAKYEPAYGGYCAYAMAEGEKVKIDPETFEIKNGRLLLFYNFRFNNTLKSWNKDEANLYKKAEAEWKRLNAGN